MQKGNDFDRMMLMREIDHLVEGAKLIRARIGQVGNTKDRYCDIDVSTSRYGLTPRDIVELKDKKGLTVSRMTKKVDRVCTCKYGRDPEDWDLCRCGTEKKEFYRVHW